MDSSLASYFILEFSLSLMIASIFLQVFVYSLRRLPKLVLTRFTVAAISFQFLVFLVCVVYYSFHAEVIHLVVLPAFVLFSTHLISFLISKQLLIASYRHLWVYPLLTPFFFLAMTIYSVCNCHDLSWGTKGLYRSAARKTGSRGILGSKSSVLREEIFRGLVLLAWVGSNATLIAGYLLSTSTTQQAIESSILLLLLTYISFKAFSGICTGLSVCWRERSAR